MAKVVAAAPDTAIIKANPNANAVFLVLSCMCSVSMFPHKKQVIPILLYGVTIRFYNLKSWKKW
jgi:hypothetical protein